LDRLGHGRRLGCPEHGLLHGVAAEGRAEVQGGLGPVESVLACGEAAALAVFGVDAEVPHTELAAGLADDVAVDEGVAALPGAVGDDERVGGVFGRLVEDACDMALALDEEVIQEELGFSRAEEGGGASVPGTRCDPAVGGLRRHAPPTRCLFQRAVRVVFRKYLAFPKHHRAG